MFENAVDLTGHKQFAIGATSQKLLDPGVYAVWSAAYLGTSSEISVHKVKG